MLVLSDNLSEVLPYIASLDKAAVDSETTGFNPWNTIKRRDVMAGISLYDGMGRSFYFPFAHSNSPNLQDNEKLAVLDAISKIKIHVGHNTKFDERFFHQGGMQNSVDFVCTQNGLYLLDETKVKALKPASEALLGKGSDAEERELNEKLATWGYGKGEMWRLPAHVVAPYAEKDAILTWDMAAYLEKKLPDYLRRLWDELNKLTAISLKMERRGVPINLATLHLLEREANIELAKSYMKIQTMSGRQCNPKSPTNIASYLGCIDAKYETLDLMRDKKPIVNEILRYKDYDKAVNTYYNPYRTEWLCDDQRIRTNFKPTGARSGRWTSSDPNLQQLPRWSKEQRVKEMICAEEGMSLVEIDYSQAEIRIAAHYTKDESLIKAIWSGKDIHQFVADEAKIDRQTAKTINFATIYGAGADRLAEQLKCSTAKAKEFLTSYNKRFPGYKETSYKAAQLAAERGYVKFWNGRHRHYTGPDEKPHTAFNQIIQGGVAQMVNAAVVEIDRQLPEAGMIIQLHDAVYFHMPTEMVESVVPEIKAIMENQPQFSVPMTVDVKVGQNLGAMKKL